jgi:8-oxo-dGTP pyrophosphatase MutT (NUDIX family)
VSTRAQRPASRIILLDPDGRVLLFRFDPPDRPPFWCLPGGALDPGESHKEAARRELLEECGIDADCDAEVFRRRVEFVTLEQVAVEADERYFLVRVAETAIDTSRHTELERAVMRSHRWFAQDEIDHWPETIYPQDLSAMLRQLQEES